MTRRPRTVSGTAGPGLIGVRLVPTVLLADADADSCAMVRDALLEGVGPSDLRTVQSAHELDDYLQQRGDHEDDRTSPPPALIVIDQDLPGNEDHDAVRSIKSNPDLRRIPVVVLTATGKYLVIGHDHYGTQGHRILGSLPQMFKLMAQAPFTNHLPDANVSTPNQKELMAVLREFLAAGKITPVVDRTYSLGEVPDALR